MNAGTLTLLAYILVLVPLMILGFYFARRKMFDPHHKMVMTLVVILNWVLIVAVMLNSYAGVAEGMPDNLSEPLALVPTIHGILGLIAQLSATYLVLLMWTENTPFERLVIYRIRNIKTPMRVTLTLWFITVLMGFGVYGVWYGNPLDNITGDETPAEVVPDPASTEESELAVPDPEATEASEEDIAPEPAVTEDSD